MLLGALHGSPKLGLSWGKIRVNLYLLRFKAADYGYGETMEDDQSFLQSKGSAVQDSSTEESAETQIFRRNDVPR